MADASIRRALNSLIKSGALPKTRAEFLDELETGGDTARYGLMEAIDKLDEKSKTALASVASGGDMFDQIADAAYGPAPAAQTSGIRNKNPNAQPERVERLPASSKADADTLPAAPKEAASPRGKVAAKPRGNAKPPAGPKAGRGKKSVAAAAEDSTEDFTRPITTPVGMFMPAASLPADGTFPQMPDGEGMDLGGVTYGSSGLPTIDPTTRQMVGQMDGGGFVADDTGDMPSAEPEQTGPAGLTPEQAMAILGQMADYDPGVVGGRPPLSAGTGGMDMSDVFGTPFMQPSPDNTPLSDLLDYETGGGPTSPPPLSGYGSPPQGYDLGSFDQADGLMSFEAPVQQVAAPQPAPQAAPQAGPQVAPQQPGAASRALQFARKHPYLTAMGIGIPTTLIAANMMGGGDQQQQGSAPMPMDYSSGPAAQQAQRARAAREALKSLNVPASGMPQ